MQTETAPISLSLALSGAQAQTQYNNLTAYQEYYSVGGCVQQQGPSNSNMTFTFGPVNTCLSIRDHSATPITLPSIVSVKTWFLTNSSCSVEYYTDLGCSQPSGGLKGVLTKCAQASAPLVATKVICP